MKKSKLLEASKEELKESEEKYRAIFTGTSDGIIGADIKTKKFAFANPQICKMLGYTEKELLKLRVPDIHPKKAWPYVMKRFNLQAKGKIKVAHNLPVLRKDKTIFYCDISVGHAEFKGKQFLFGVFRDITERKKTEEELKLSEEKFKSIYDFAPILIDAFDKNGKCTLWNKACEDVFGWKIEAINAHKNPLALFYPDSKVRKEVIKTVSSKPANVFREWHPMTKKGVKISTMWANFKLPNGEVINIGYDITERKKAEDTLEKSEKIFEDLYETSITLAGSHVEILQKICDKVHSAFDGFFVLVNYAKAGEFHFKAGCNLPGEVVSAGKEPIKGAICSHVLESKEPLFTNELDKAKCPTCKMPYIRDSAVKAFKLKTYFGVPLIFSDGSTHGTLCIVFKEKKEPFTEKDLKIMRLLARRVSSEIEHEEAETVMKKKAEELDKFTKFAVGRELQMIELKKRFAAQGVKQVNK